MLDKVRAELLLPGFSAGGTGISICFSADRVVGKGAGAIIGFTDLLPACAAFVGVCGVDFPIASSFTALRGLADFMGGLTSG